MFQQEHLKLAYHNRPVFLPSTLKIHHNGDFELPSCKVRRHFVLSVDFLHWLDLSRLDLQNYQTNFAGEKTMTLMWTIAFGVCCYASGVIFREPTMALIRKVLGN